LRAHLVRYGSDAAVGTDYRGASEIRWILCGPTPEAVAAGHQLTSACLAQMREWGARRIFANGDLPAPVLAAAGQWLELAGTGLLLTYLSEESSEAERAFVVAAGFTNMITTVRLLERGRNKKHGI
jgi:hypothetical protein